MNRTTVVIMVFAAALLGASLAIVGGILFQRQMLANGPGPWMHRGGGFGAPPGGRPPLEQVLPRLARALELTPAQIERIRPRVVESQRQFEAARESLRSRIDAELTPAQRLRWQSMERMHGMGRPFHDAPGDEHPDRPQAGEPGEPR